MDANSTDLLLQTMMGGQLHSDQAQTLMEQYISQRSAEDPRIGILMNLMAQQRAAAEAELENKVTEQSTDLEQINLAHGISQQVNHEKKQKLKEKVAVIYLELREMRQRNQIFAAAVGACPNCWGNDSSCEICQGIGRPGAYTIDPSLFADLVVPAIAQYKKLHGLKASPSTRTTPELNSEKS